MFINEKREDCFGEILDFKVDTLKPKTYYVVEIKHKKVNPIHRCIMATEFGDEEGTPTYCELYNHSYEGVETKRIKGIYWFRIVKEITEMKR
jgi:hypothetical protein